MALIHPCILYESIFSEMPGSQTIINYAQVAAFGSRAKRLAQPNQSLFLPVPQVRHW